MQPVGYIPWCTTDVALLFEMNDEHDYLVYYTEVRWISRGRMLKRMEDCMVDPKVLLYAVHCVIVRCCFINISISNYHTVIKIRGDNCVIKLKL